MGDGGDDDGVQTLHRELARALGPDATRSRRSSSLVRAELTRTLTSAPRRRAPWNASNWRPPAQLAHAELDRRAWLARAALDAYAAHNAAHRAVAARDEAADARGDAELLARAHGVLASTLAADIVDDKLAALGAARAARRRETYERWDAHLYRPLAEELADAVDERARERLVAARAGSVGATAAAAAAAAGRRGSSGGSVRSARGGGAGRGHSQARARRGGGLVVRPAVPLTLRDPMKRVLMKRVEEDALMASRSAAGAVLLELPRARARDMLPPTFWSPQALNSTPHGYLTQRRGAAAATAAGAAASAAAALARVFHDDFSGCGAVDGRGRLVAVDAEFPTGKRAAPRRRRATGAALGSSDTAHVVQQGESGEPAPTPPPRRRSSAPPRPVGGRATVCLV